MKRFWLLAVAIVIALGSFLASKKRPQHPNEFLPQKAAIQSSGMAASQSIPSSSGNSALTILDFQSSFQSYSREELAKVISSIEARVLREQWILRANRNELNEVQLQHLASLLNQRAAAGFLLLEKEIAEIEAKL